MPSTDGWRKYLSWLTLSTGAGLILGWSTCSRSGLVTTTRLEAFSDGIFAIAITLLILAVHLPAEATAGHLCDITL